MIPQPIKVIAVPAAIGLSFSFAALLMSNSASANCDLTKVPLTRESRCNEYKADDAKLNSAYRALSGSIDKDKRKDLLKIQREWISWRDEKCDAVQESIQCGNSFCDGVAHDSCVIDLTIRRTKELEFYTKNPALGSTNQYSYSKEYEYE